jgi:hypothetical protein
MNDRNAIVVAALISIAGMLAHNIMEFGWIALIRIDTFSVPWVLLWSMALWMWLKADGSTGAMWTLVVMAVLNLIPGAVLSVLPLGFLPFEPERSGSHYASHVVYGVTQMPFLIFAAMWLLRQRQHSTS